MLKKLKKLGITILTSLIIVTGVGQLSLIKADQTLPQLDLEAKSAIAIDAKTGQIIYAKDDKQIYPVASMSKLLTAYILLQAIHEGKITWETKVTPTVTEVDISNNTELTNVPLKEGHSYTIKQLYQAMLVGSANAATMLIGNAISGTQTKFIDKMRETAKSLGITDAKIYSANGLTAKYLGDEIYPNTDENAENEFSVRDMAIISQKLIKEYPEILETTKLTKIDFNDNGEITTVNNTNELLQDDSHLEVDGLKTGTSDAAGYCFASTTNKDGHRIITVIAGAKDNDARFDQTKNLLNYIYNNYDYLAISTDRALRQNVKVKYGKQGSVPATIGNNLSLWVPKNIKEKALQIKLIPKSSTIEAPIKQGEVVGEYQISVAGNLGSIDGSNNLKTKALSDNNVEGINIFIKWWQMLSDAI
ncbi:serine hydrolase [Ligilactobacillus salivarius]|uniref:serine-type D-Ala-D-Ala carboxypeptidase n=3 Tax=Ligilactobacillus salivarius TaxID=1624 RepID=V6DIC9_9LACO|nr:serine hydrolase [Ligilactobacillus salivarius]CDK34441.1 D-alanyl-D-alanine carboxypeptidase [Ligilactobacillus salivarius cp400]AIR09879.1 D-alanyl-D-alanine serine-type carboxypeptidase [Ligilactobacillus salivarius]ARU20034.1 cytochrome C [Ligilactobacillus salivarius]MCF2622852.1 D-alanyl-D-alanine carboxypeptidase [Ligilactobacillus salivarius]MDY2639596.1 serine hydrolase [Ligilactobacillus salivarius]